MTLCYSLVLKTYFIALVQSSWAIVLEEPSPLAFGSCLFLKIEQLFPQVTNILLAPSVHLPLTMFGMENDRSQLHMLTVPWSYINPMKVSFIAIMNAT